MPIPTHRPESLPRSEGRPSRKVTNWRAHGHFGIAERDRGTESTLHPSHSHLGACSCRRIAGIIPGYRLKYRDPALVIEGIAAWTWLIFVADIKNGCVLPFISAKLIVRLPLAAPLSRRNPPGKGTPPWHYSLTTAHHTEGDAFEGWSLC